MYLWSALYHLDITQVLFLLLIVQWPEGVISQPKGSGPIPSKELQRVHNSSNFVEKCFLGKNIPLYPPFGLRLKRNVLTSVLVLCCVSSYEGGRPTEMYICQNRSKQRQLAANIRPTSHLSLFVLQSTAQCPWPTMLCADQDCCVHWKSPTCSSKVGFNSNKYSIRENLPGLHMAEETI